MAVNTTANKMTMADIQRVESMDDLRKRLRPAAIGQIDWKDVLTEAVYGRVCNTLPGQSTPTTLSKRGTAFVFGPDTVCNDMLVLTPYQFLLKLGYSPEYIRLKVCEQKRNFSILLFRMPPNMVKSKPIAPATWSGLEELVAQCYPLALEAVSRNMAEMKINSCEYFETGAGFKFMDALRDTEGPLFMSYEKFARFEHPQKARETRLFLYSELRINELFTGCGYTAIQDGAIQDGGVGVKEYMCPNVKIDDFGKDNYVVLPLSNIDMPDY